jgi:hypothetical protein
MSRIAEDLGDGKQVPTGNLLSQLLPTIDADEYRRELIYIRETGQAAGLTNTLQWVVRAPKVADLTLQWLSWSNGMAADRLILEMFLLRAFPIVGNFQQLVGKCIVEDNATEMVVGNFNNGPQSRLEFRPKQIRVPAGKILFVQGSNETVGPITNSNQTLEATFLRAPPTRSYSRTDDLATFDANP